MKNFLKEFKNKINQKIEFKKVDASNLVTSFQGKIKKLAPKIDPSTWIPTLQDKLEKLARVDTSSILLNQTRFWAKSITWVLMGGTVFAIGWISVAKTEEIVVARGKLEPKGGVIEVQIPLNGIVSEMLVEEGEQVKKDQVLIRLDTNVTEAKNQALQKTFELNNTIEKKLALLVKEGAVSELQYLQHLAKLEDLKGQIKTNLITMSYQEIISPIDGMVFELQPKGPGFVAQTSKPILTIVPLNNLQASVEIDSRTIGFVKTGKPVDISIDSFPASDFGVIKGTVKSIGSDALDPIASQGKGYRFPANITLNNQYLKLKSGEKLTLKAGMGITANIKLRKVTYLQLLLNKFSEKADSLRSI